MILSPYLSDTPKPLTVVRHDLAFVPQDNVYTNPNLSHGRLSFPRVLGRNPRYNIHETHSVYHKGATLVGYSSPYTVLDVRGPYYDPDSNDDHCSAFDGLIGLEESRRVQGYTGRLKMTIKGVARQFCANTFGPEIYDDEWDGYGSEEELGSEEGEY